MRRFRRSVVVAAALCALVTTCTPQFVGDEPARKGAWQFDKTQQPGIVVHTMEMVLHPKAEARPALKYQLIDDDFHLQDGNAAIHYLKATGFLEQGHMRKRLEEVYDEANRIAKKEDKALQQVPPFAWQNTPPAELPLAEVKEFLEITSFQTPFIKTGTRQRRFDLDRNIREIDDPLGYLVPEIQAIRELARMQHLRCKVAIAENRIDDAIEILHQQYTMARHLGQDDFYITGIVGISFAHLAWEDALQLVQTPDAPNLYWAFASVPRPAVDLSHNLATERQLLFQQLKVLREVDEVPRPAGYWQDCVDRLAAELGRHPSIFAMSHLKDRPEDLRAAVVTFIAGAYPSARRYLIEDCGMDREQVEAYPTAQTVLLAVVRYYQEAADTCVKWNYLPYWQAVGTTAGKEAFEFLPVSFERAGWIAIPATMILPAVQAGQMASARIDQQLALSQTVEAIRMYGATSGGKLPASLDELPLPAPMEPLTGSPLSYQRHADHAVLEGHDLRGMRYRLVLRFAKASGRP